MFDRDAFFPHYRTYITKWSAEDCRMFLAGKNIYDVFEHSFEEKCGKYYITFKEQIRFRHPRKRHDPVGVYSISFEETGGETRFTVKFECREDFFEDSPCVDSESMDKFFEIKLDARKAWPGE